MCSVVLNCDVLPCAQQFNSVLAINVSLNETIGNLISRLSERVMKNMFRNFGFEVHLIAVKDVRLFLLERRKRAFVYLKVVT